MDSQTRRRALRAAAKLAFGAAFAGVLPGCGGHAVVDLGIGSMPGAGPAGSTAQPSFEPSGAVADAGPGNLGTGGVGVADRADGLRCLGTVDLQLDPAFSTPISDAQFACCRDYDNASVTLLRDAGLSSGFDADPSFVNCCKAIIAGTDRGLPRDPNENVFAYPARIACCASSDPSAQGELWQHRFCSPWGPPMPPALQFTARGEA